MDRLLLNNVFLRILALVLACVLWLSVDAPNAANTAGITEKFPFPVHIEAARNVVVTSISDATATVVVNGNITNMTSLPAQMLSVAVVANATGLTPGRHVVRLAAVNMPPVNYSIQPATVTVNLARVATVTRAVQIQMTGTAAEGYATAQPTTNVSTVTVRGAASEVSQVASVVAAVSVQDATSPVARLVTLIPVSADGKTITGVRLTPSAAMINVPVQAPKAMVGTVAQLSGNPKPGFAVSGIAIDPNLVMVFGQPSATTPAAIEIPVDVTGLAKSQTLRVQIPVIAGVSKVRPGSVTVSVTIEQSLAKNVQNVPIQMENLAAGESVTINGVQTVSVTVSGPMSLVQPLSAADVGLYVDASRLHAGNNVAPVNVLLPDWVQATHLSRKVISVNVSVASASGK